jgi:hypothetical protein
VKQAAAHHQSPPSAGTTASARFTFDPNKIEWSLRCSDRNGRWHAYNQITPTRHFAELVAEVERDPTGIFLG